MAGNCTTFQDVNTINHFQCKYDGAGLVNGQYVSRPDKIWKGRLASCETTSSISDTTYAEIQKMAYYIADGKSANLNPEQFRCNIFSTTY